MNIFNLLGDAPGVLAALQHNVPDRGGSQRQYSSDGSVTELDWSTFGQIPVRPPHIQAEGPKRLTDTSRHINTYCQYKH